MRRREREKNVFVFHVSLRVTYDLFILFTQDKQLDYCFCIEGTTKKNHMFMKFGLDTRIFECSVHNIINPISIENSIRQK